MKRLPRLALLFVTVGLTGVASATSWAEPPKKSLPLDGEVFEVAGHFGRPKPKGVGKKRRRRDQPAPSPTCNGSL